MTDMAAETIGYARCPGGFNANRRNDTARLRLMALAGLLRFLESRGPASKPQFSAAGWDLRCWGGVRGAEAFR